MSDPRPLAARLDAALTDEVLDKGWRIAVKAETAALEFLDGEDKDRAESEGYAAMRAVLIAALLPVVEEPLEDYAIVNELAMIECPCGDTFGSIAIFADHARLAHAHRLPPKQPAEGPTDDTLARVATFRKILARSGEDRIRASIILQTFNDLFVVSSA